MRNEVWRRSGALRNAGGFLRGLAGRILPYQEMNMKQFNLGSLILILAAFSAFAFDRTPKDHWAKYDGGKVHYYDIGNHKAKNALILVHGWTCDADLWKGSYGAFPNYRVIAIDLPGHGRSDKPKVNYSMEYFARSIEAVI